MEYNRDLKQNCLRGLKIPRVKMGNGGREEIENCVQHMTMFVLLRSLGYKD